MVPPISFGNADLVIENLSPRGRIPCDFETEAKEDFLEEGEIPREDSQIGSKRKRDFDTAVQEDFLEEGEIFEPKRLRVGGIKDLNRNESRVILDPSFFKRITSQIIALKKNKYVCFERNWQIIYGKYHDNFDVIHISAMFHTAATVLKNSSISNL